MASVSHRSAELDPGADLPSVSVSVFKFGARGDNVDDTDAIQAAVDYMNVNGGTLYFPPGIYRVKHGYVITKDGVQIVGAGKRSTIVQLEPTAAASLFTYTQVGSTPIQHCSLMHMALKAGADTTYTKVAIDMYGARFCTVYGVEVQAWEGAGSIALRVRGWDNCVYDYLRLDATYPLVIGIDDVDPTKDLDHTVFSNSAYVARGDDKIAIDLLPGTATRNVTFHDLSLVQGIVRSIDGATVPKRRSTNMLFQNIRVEGLSESGSTPAYAFDFQKHANGKLMNLKFINVLMGEGPDARYDTSLGAAWGGVRANGVVHTDLDDCRYAGRADPYTTDGRLTSTNSQLAHEDNGRIIPLHSSQWTIANVTAPRSWWVMRNTGTTMSDEQAVIADLDLDLQSPTTLPVVSQFIDGWSGTWLQFTGVDFQRARLNSSDASLDPATQNVAALQYVRFHTSAPGGNREVCNLGGSTDGPRLRMNSSGQLFLSAGGVNGTPSVATYQDGKVCLVWFAVNHGASSISAYVRKTDGTAETISVAYTVTLSNGINKGLGSSISGQLSFEGHVRFAGWFLGTAAQQVASTVATSLGW